MILQNGNSMICHSFFCCEEKQGAVVLRSVLPAKSSCWADQAVTTHALQIRTEGKVFGRFDILKPNTNW